MDKLFGYIQTYEEACLVVHAVRLGYLNAIEGRLSVEDRENIRSGDIFCFVELAGGMKRWTDGKIWSPSKIHGQFLLYKEVPRNMNKSAIGKRNRQKSLMGVNRNNRCKERVIDWDDKLSLSKKTISISLQNKTYHIIAYFRPIFSRISLMNIPLFNQLDKALRKYSSLLSDEFLISVLDENDFHVRFELAEPTRESAFPEVRRNSLERIASSVLCEWMRSKVMNHNIEDE